MKKYISEFIGTLILVLFGCGVAVYSNATLLSTSLAFGLSIVVIYYSIGKISGCHLNPAVSFAMYLRKDIDGKTFFKYVLAQVLGAIVASLLLALIINNTQTLGDFKTTGLGQNTFGNGGVTMFGAFITESILSFIFILTILGVTSDKKYDNIAGIVIGLALVFVHLFGIKLTGTSVNPARSIGPALVMCFKDFETLKQVWLFILAPMFGSSLAYIAYKNLLKK